MCRGHTIKLETLKQRYAFAAEAHQVRGKPLLANGGLQAEQVAELCALSTDLFSLCMT